MTAALTISGLSVRHRRGWVLRDCSLSVPSGRVAALVGPNGAGKTTLLHVVTGLLTQQSGTVAVVGDVAFMAQDKPLYDTFTIAETLTFGSRLNPRWDGAYAARRLAELGIAPRRKVKDLSGGQQAQVALTLALARRPDLLVLDEPLANLDPLARHDVMRALMGEVAERRTTVLISSHVVADLHDTCDWLIVLNGGRVQVSGDIDDLLDGHLVLSGPDGLKPPAGAQVIEESRTGRQVRLLVRGAQALDPRWNVRQADLDELVMAYLRSPEASALPRLSEVPV
ncbi:ABC transporter ATP-binding protein [Nonomuraea sp. NPDC050691]|uniref:ABC transporter ATP-binding protein n=1 Tax=Nonomuraea sp. NPDC050691 TaxID=3155661 RepID=UPI00340CAA80